MRFPNRINIIFLSKEVSNYLPLSQKINSSICTTLLSHRFTLWSENSLPETRSLIYSIMCDGRDSTKEQMIWSNTSYDLWVQSLKARVEIQKWEFKSMGYEFKSASYQFKSTSHEFKPTSHELKSTSYEFKSTSYEFKSMSYKFQSTSYEFKSMSWNSKVPVQKSMSYGFKSACNKFKPTSYEFKSTS